MKFEEAYSLDDLDDENDLQKIKNEVYIYQEVIKIN